MEGDIGFGGMECRGERGLAGVIEHAPLEGVEQGEIGLKCVIERTPLDGASQVDGRGKYYTGEIGLSLVS